MHPWTTDATTIDKPFNWGDLWNHGVAEDSPALIVNPNPNFPEFAFLVNKSAN
jgi:hypothetical protein